jgi:hypothetical protein
LLSFLGVIIPSLLAGIWWLGRDDRDIQAASLRLRSRLVSTFQTAIVKEAQRLFRAVEVYLPSALSQAREVEPRRSAFDILIEGLHNIQLGRGEAANEECTERQQLEEVLKLAIGEHISDEIERCLENTLHSLANSDQSQSDVHAGEGLPMNFEARNEHVLTGIAHEMSRCMRRERICRRSKPLAQVSLALAVIGAFTIAPAVVFNIEAGNLLAILGFGLIGLGFLGGTCSAVIYYLVKEKHREAADRLRSPSDVEQYLLSGAQW